MKTLGTALLTCILAFPAFAVGFPESAPYRGRSVEADGTAFTGTRSVEVAYFEADEKLLTETFSAVGFAEGRFEIALGSGAFQDGSRYATFQELAAHHPALELAFQIGGIAQAPRVRLMPAGHSIETGSILSGLASANDGSIHSKKWRPRGGVTGIQAAILRPGTPMRLTEGPSPEFQQGAMEVEMIGPSLSIPVRDMPGIDTSIVHEVEDQEINPPRFEDLLDENGQQAVNLAPDIVDELAARSHDPLFASPPPIQNFDGINNVSGVLPPDTEGVVGPNHYVQVVNLVFSIYTKAGALVTGPTLTNALWAGFVGANCASNNNGDAIFLYDRYADRYLLTQFSVSGAQAVCFAVSQTNDPTGSYYRYAVNTQRFPDYFKLGTWPDPANNAWFMGTNSGATNQYDVYALDRENMLLGLAARPAQFFLSNVNLMMPADAGSALLPPAGSRALFYTMRNGGTPQHGTPPADSLDLWQFHVDWTTPASSTWTMVESFTSAAGGLANFNWTICGFFNQNCLNQPGTTQGLDSSSWWPMKRLHYRNFGDHESLVGSWTVDVTGTPDLAGIRWFELRRTGGDWAIHQQGTFTNGESGVTAAHRWLPSIAMDRDGGIAVGYSVMKDNGGSGDLFATIRYATRALGDPPGTLQNETTLFTGTGAQTHSAARWGDYASMSVDPVDDCTYWFTSEYLSTTGNAPWRTRIGSFKMPGCGALQLIPTSREVCALTTTSTTFDIEVLAPGFGGTTDLDVAGCPAGASCDFSVDPIVNPAVDSVLTLSDLDALSAGVYQMDVTATDAGDASNNVARPISIVIETGSAPTTLVAPADNATGVPIAAPLSWSAVAGAVSYDVEVDDDADFSSPEFTETLAGTSTVATGLASNEVYFWRVRSVDDCGGAFTADFSFRTVTEMPFLDGFETENTQRWSLTVP